VKNNLLFMKNDFLKPKRIFGLIFILFMTMSSLACILWSNPKISKFSDKNVPLTEPISIVFNAPIDRDKLIASIEPKTLGTWSYGNKLWLGNHLFFKLIFTPETAFIPKTNYNITLSNLTGPLGLGKSSSKLSIKFATQSLPEIKSIEYSDNNGQIPVCSPITVNLTAENNNIADFDFNFLPENSVETILSPDKKSYQVFPDPCFSIGTKYALIANRTLEIGNSKGNLASTVYEDEFITESNPFITSFSPKGSTVGTDTKSIRIKFAEPMIQKEINRNIIIRPEVSGKWEWQDSRTLVFLLKNNLSYDTLYTIDILKGIHSEKGILLDKNISLSFRTIGEVKVDNFWPRNGANEVSDISEIFVSFNQSVDKKNTESKFVIKPKIKGTFSWASNTLIFKPDAKLQKNTKYAVTILNGVKGTKGLPSSKKYSAVFMTASDNYKLDIGMDFQDKALSCEAASLKMALAYKNVSVSEDEIMKKIGFDGTPHYGNIWGDPHKAFVGNINGRQNTTGYGVYWEPVANASQSWRNAKAFTNGTLSQLAREISEGNPVIIWGTVGNTKIDSWKTKDGKEINAWRGEHARVVTGFSGTIDHPSAFYLNDPLAGKIVWPAEDLLRNWSAFDNSGVVIY